MDDTLYLERDYVWSGFRSVGEWARRRLGIPDLADVAWDAFVNGARGTIFNLALQRSGIDPTAELIEQLVDAYRGHRPDIELCSDARDCLDSLRGTMPLATVTDGPLVSQRAKAEALGLDRWIETMVFTAELGPEFGKPHPRAFELVQERTGVPGSRCIYVADNPAKDFDAPHALGWRTVRIRRPAALHSEVESNERVDLEVTDLGDVAALTGIRQPR